MKITQPRQITEICTHLIFTVNAQALKHVTAKPSLGTLTDVWAYGASHSVSGYTMYNRDIWLEYRCKIQNYSSQDASTGHKSNASFVAICLDQKKHKKRKATQLLE
jgi:hypothetical protein